MTTRAVIGPWFGSGGTSVSGGRRQSAVPTLRSPTFRVNAPPAGSLGARVALIAAAKGGRTCTWSGGNVRTGAFRPGWLNPSVRRYKPETGGTGWVAPKPWLSGLSGADMVVVAVGAAEAGRSGPGSMATLVSSDRSGVASTTGSQRPTNRWAAGIGKPSSIERPTRTPTRDPAIAAPASDGVPRR